MVERPTAVERIMRAVDDLDVSIRQVRSTIFELHQRWSLDRRACAARSSPSVQESAKALGFKPSCDIVGPIDSAVIEPDPGTPAALPSRGTVQRRPSRSARQRSRSSSRVGDGRLALTVTDDGVGYVADDDPSVERARQHARASRVARRHRSRSNRSGRRRHRHHVGRSAELGASHVVGSKALADRGSRSPC